MARHRRGLRRVVEVVRVGVSTRLNLRPLQARRIIVAKPKSVTDFNPNSQSLPVRGSTSGGSQPTPQARILKMGSGKLSGSAPKSPQKLRG